MLFSRDNIRYTLNGILFVALFAVAATRIAAIPVLSRLALSPLIIGIVIGMVYANTLRGHLPKEWVPGILFSSKSLLRFAIIFYGFRITFQQIASVGLEGLTLSTIMVASTFLLGAFVGQKLLGMDRDTTLLTSAGSSVCGAAAVLATEPVLRAEPHKSAIAVGTVVLFGTVSMFMYPVLFRSGLLHMTPEVFGMYVGGTVHEVAHVVGAATAVGEDVARVAVIVKMIRVILIAPLLIALGLVLSARAGAVARSGAGLDAAAGAAGTNSGARLVIPWFAVGFIAVSAFNSFNLLPSSLVATINRVDTFLLTMAMTALGMETNAAKFRQAGIKPFVLAFVLFVWLVFGGYFLTTAIAAAF